MTCPVASLVQAIEDCSTLPHDMLTERFTATVADRCDEQQFADSLSIVAKAMHDWWMV